MQLLTSSDFPVLLIYFKIKKTFFLTWTIFKVFIEFVTILLVFYVLAVSHVES